MSQVISVGIFKEKECFHQPSDIRLVNLMHTFDTQKFKLKGRKVHTYADPFLFEHQDKLYLFAEIQEFNSPGFLNVWQYQADESWQDLGPTLKQATHLSYPFIFKDKDKSVYLIPESGQSGEVNLWFFDSFPDKVRKRKTILLGCYSDSSIILHGDVYYLFTTNEDKELLIFFNRELLSDTWTPHPCNPITNDTTISRNGGGVISLGNQLIRIAQNCSERYGGGIVVLTIETLTETAYKETIAIADFKPEKDYDWQKNGRHHLSICRFKSNTFVAIDGYATNSLLNRILNKVARTF